MMSRVVRFCFVLSILVMSQTSIRAQVFLNEFHYDNTGADANEYIEVAGLAGTDLSAYSIYMYNGGDGTFYFSFPLTGTLTNQCVVGGNNVGTAFFDIFGLSMGLQSFQNGAPDGFALVGPGSTLLEFYSYEGTFVATNGPAAGQLSIEITSESSSSPVGSSIQRAGVSSWIFGSGTNTFGACNTSQYFPASSNTVNLSVSSNAGSEATASTPITVTATASANVTGNQTVNLTVSGPFITAGDYNLSNTVITIPSGSNTGSVTFNVVDDVLYEGIEKATLIISGPSSGIVLGGSVSQIITITSNDAKPAYEVWTNEVHYDNGPSDSNERIEIAGASGTNLAGWSIYLYDGTTFTPYGSPIALSGVLPVSCTVSGENVGVTVVDVLATSGSVFQDANGDPDGWALVDNNGGVVEFLSYEGTFSTTIGPANGLTSTDIGVFEDGTGNPNGSIQRTTETVWVVGATSNTFGACNSTQYFPVPPCPTFSGAPSNVSITNSTCNPMCTVTGGSITAPGGSPCPAGSTLQYQVNGGSWSATLPTYNTTGPAQSIKTRCSCDNDPMMVSSESMAVTTVPGTCIFTTWYQDLDGDGYGNAAVTQSYCNQPMGYVNNSNDCNDNNAALNLPPYLVTLNGVCYATIESALAAAVSGNTIQVEGNINSIGINTIPAGITVQINNGASWTNNMTLTNNGTITEVGTGSFVNGPMGLYKGTGNFNGSLVNNGTVNPGN
ncbi:MAG: hypothetical protein U0V54_06830 [Saprospiraceae bacterium]